MFRLPLVYFTVLLLSPLASTGQLSSTTAQICQGVTQPEEWETYENITFEDVRGIVVHVDTRGCNFTTLPQYIATLESVNGYHWFMTGATSVYKPTVEGFDIYIRWVDHPTEDPLIGSKQYANPLTTATAQELGLYIRWTALKAIEQPVMEEEEEPVSLAPRDPARDYAADDLFQLSPNPTIDRLTINAAERFDRFELVAVTGAILSKFTQTTLTVGELAPGTYFVRAYRGDRFGLQRFVKQ